MSDSADTDFMQRALLIAQRGLGRVEPNPMVGCVVVRDGTLIGEGWHEQFGAAHAEVNALSNAGDATGATLYVTLEPCCHTGKTPPCTQAVINANIRRVIVGTLDPSDKVAGKGVQLMRDAGIEVKVGICRSEATQLVAPFRKLSVQKRPWLIAKWAMSLDGKIATRSQDSRWISNPESRKIAHQIRGRVDAIMVGKGTAEADDPLLTARPAGPREATRIVIDSNASISETSQLVQTANEAPVLIAVGPDARPERKTILESAGCEVFVCDAKERNDRLVQLLDELGRRQMTNMLCEGGSQLLGSLFDQQLIDEVHTFIAPKLIGGDNAPSPLAARGINDMPSSGQLVNVAVESVGNDVYVRGVVQY